MGGQIFQNASTLKHLFKKKLSISYPFIILPCNVMKRYAHTQSFLCLFIPCSPY